MQSVDKLMLEREITALNVTIGFRLSIILFILLPGAIFLSKSKFETTVVASVIIISVMICVFSVFFLKRKIFVRPVGIVGSILDVIVVTILPVIWYLSVGGTSVNPAYMIKGPLYQTALWIILVYNSFAIQQIYIIIVMTGGILGYLGHFAYIFYCGRTLISSSYTLHNLGNGVSPEFVFTMIFGFAAIGIGLIVFSGKMKKTIYLAIKNESVSNQLGRFFSPKVRDELMLLNEQMDSEKGKLQDVAVLFSDVRDFTSYCNDKSPEEIVSFLKEYQTIMVDIIFRNNGTLDKFIGDGIMATFGTPSTGIDDADNAVKTAIEMSSALKELNLKRNNAGLSEIRIGIGIHYGPVIVGSLGSENRLEYTVIGDTVNIASRLESATKKLQKEIIFSEDLKNKISEDIHARSIGLINIRGREKTMRVYSI